MGLGIYSAADATTKLSDDGSFNNPLNLTFDGRLGGTKEVRLYIRNDNPLYYYTDITLVPTDPSAEPIINDPDNGYVWKLSVGDTQPTTSDWKNISGANQITFTDIGSAGTPDTSTYLPFWILIQVPPGLAVDIKDAVKLQISANEVLV